MCAEFTLGRPPRDIARYFGIDDVPQFEPRGSLFPKMPVAVVGRKPDGVHRGLAFLRWGLVPHWYNDTSQKPQPFNARAESVDKLPEFRDSFRHRRCIVPADAFFEWGLVAGKKRKHRFRFADGRLFAFAGLWDVWDADPEHKLTTCTGKPNPMVAAVHNRMPVILDPADYDTWLDPATPVEKLRSLLKPYPDEGMECLPL
jgi:putative SOS response-associated peptidase YedK